VVTVVDIKRRFSSTVATVGASNPDSLLAADFPGSYRGVTVMRRPINWIAVSIAILFLLVNLMVAGCGGV
jgi:hypothetical protein